MPRALRSTHPQSEPVWQITDVESHPPPYTEPQVSEKSVVVTCKTDMEELPPKNLMEFDDRNDPNASSVRTQLSDFCKNTSFTAITKIYQASSIIKKLGWLILILAMMTYLSLQIYWLLQKYFSYPSEVTIDLKAASELEFPSVTICNVNPIQLDKLSQPPLDTLQPFIDAKEPDDFLYDSTLAYYDYYSGYYDYYDYYDYNDTTTTPADYLSMDTDTPPPFDISSEPMPLGRKRRSADKDDDIQTGEEAQRREKRSYPMPPPPAPGDAATRRRERLASSNFSKWDILENETISRSFYQTRDKEYTAAEVYAALTRTASPKAIAAGGMSSKEFIVGCKWNGYQCSPKNFTTVINHKYGVCFTFNTAINTSETLITKVAGPANGLVLELYIDQLAYVGTLAPEAGVRVVVHPRGSYPFPHDQGITVPPGWATSIGMRMVEVTRLPEPHGTCDKSSESVVDLYTLAHGTNYSKLSCMKSCYQELILSYCHCAYAGYEVPEASPVCDMQNVTVEACVSGMPQDYPEEYDACDKKCPQPCSEIKYEKEISAASWPSTPYATTLMRRIEQSSSVFLGKPPSSSSLDFAKVLIYYEDLLYEEIKQQVSYESQNLISDIGGQLGLWLGLSAITIGELCTLCMAITQTATRRIFYKPLDDVHHTPVQVLTPPRKQPLYDQKTTF